MKILHSGNNALITNIVNNIGNTNKATNSNQQLPTAQVYEYPYINGEAFKLSLNQYRKKAHAYNESIKQERLDVEAHNTLVRVNNKVITPTREETKALALFQPTVSNKATYNQQVDAFNAANRLKAIKIAPKKIKAPTEMVFTTLLSSYVSQLKKRNELFKNTGVTTTGTLPKLQINSHNLSTKQISKNEDAPILDMSKRTVQRHINRLYDLGVLVGYEYHGTKKPTRAYFSSEIVLVLDYKLSKKLSVENQPFTLVSASSCCNTRNTTSTLKETLKKERVDNSTLIKGNLSNKSQGYKNTKKESETSSEPQALNQVSAHLNQQIQEQSKLATELSDQDHNNYVPIDADLLKFEAKKGTLSQEEFKTLVIQDFLKHSARLWKGKSAYAAVWMKALLIFEDKKLQNHVEQLYHKDTMLQHLLKWRWMLMRAVAWCGKEGHYAIYPGQFFETNRTETHEGGFWHWEKKYEAGQRRKKDAKNKQVSSAKKGKERKSDHRKFVAALNKYKAGKSTITGFQDYVTTTLPAIYHNKVGTAINKLNAKKNSKI